MPIIRGTEDKVETSEHQVCPAWSHLRPEVKQFALAMEDKLRKNDWKGKDSWKGDHPIALVKRIEDETKELWGALEEISDPHNVMDESVDIANFAMMVYDVSKASIKE